MNQPIASSSSSSIPMDPALSMYSPQYYQYPQSQQSHQHLNPPSAVPTSLSSPSSQGSETMATPPTEYAASTSTNANGKRPVSPRAQLSNGQKKPRKDEDVDEDVLAEKGDEPTKAKPTRGSRYDTFFHCARCFHLWLVRACTVCRRLKMKCVGAENGPPCKRCQAGNHECIFEESNRGKRSTK